MACWQNFHVFFSPIPYRQGLWWDLMQQSPSLGVRITNVVFHFSCSFLSNIFVFVCLRYKFNLSLAVWKVMEMCYQILLQETRVTQRELFYKLLCDSPHLFPSQTHVNRTIQGYYYCVLSFLCLYFFFSYNFEVLTGKSIWVKQIW